MAGLFIALLAFPVWAGEWRTGDQADIWFMCTDFQAAKDVAAGAVESDEHALAAMRAGMRADRCVNLPMPITVVLQEKMLEFVDYENDLMEVWRLHISGGSGADFFYWLVADSGPHPRKTSI